MPPSPSGAAGDTRPGCAASAAGRTANVARRGGVEVRCVHRIESAGRGPRGSEFRGARTKKVYPGEGPAAMIKRRAVTCLRLMPPIQRHLAAGETHVTMKHAPGRQQLFAQMPDLLHRTPQDGHLQAVPLAEMDVQAGNDEIVMVVLLVDQPGGELPGVVVVDEGDDGHPLARGRLLFLADRAGRGSGRGSPRCAWRTPWPCWCGRRRRAGHFPARC